MTAWQAEKREREREGGSDREAQPADSRTPAQRAEAHGNALGVSGWVLVAAGTLAVIAGFAMESAPPGSRTVNYDFMLMRLMVLIAGAAGVVAGAALVAGGAVVAALGRTAIEQAGRDA